jgi:hypothetical protein
MIDLSVAAVSRCSEQRPPGRRGSAEHTFPCVSFDAVMLAVVVAARREPVSPYAPRGFTAMR